MIIDAGMDSWYQLFQLGQSRLSIRLEATALAVILV
jgi:hypothetical protein